MNDINGLLAAFDSGELVRPSADALNLVDLAGYVGSLGGASRRPGAANTSLPTALA